MDFYLHYVTYDERNQFGEPIAQRWFALVSRLPEPCTLRYPNRAVPSPALASANDKLQVRFPWGYEVGIPRRYVRHLRQPALLAEGQWLQVRFNEIIYADGLHGYGGTRFYDKRVTNIGFVDAFVPTLFVAGPPAFQITDFAHLR